MKSAPDSELRTYPAQDVLCAHGPGLPGRFTAIDSRDLVNFDISYRPNNGSWTLSAYGKNVTDERYDNARLNTGDYVLVMLSNDASEFGLRFTREF